MPWTAKRYTPAFWLIATSGWPSWLDRPGVVNYAESLLPTAGLIKLRDLPDDFWNAATLFILTKTHQKARQMGKIIEKEDWGADEIHVFSHQEEIDRALGTGRQNNGLLRVWWD